MCFEMIISLYWIKWIIVYKYKFYINLYKWLFFYDLFFVLEFSK